MSAVPPMREAVVRALAEGGAIADARDGFVPREGQQALAGAIAEAIESAGALVAEAGTGTGKTYAYLVPALLAGSRVMIATGTRTLQDQLFERDLPRVRDALGVQAQVALLKGRSNYVCLHHLARNLADGRFARREDIVDLRRIDLYAKVTTSGDRAGLGSVPEDAPAWAMATSTRENCLGQDCEDYSRCFVFKARQAAQQADIVVVNHHLFCADLALRDEGVSELLPTTSVLIFDEAHQLPEVATSFFGVAVSSRQLVEFARDVLRTGLADARDAADWTTLSAALEQSVRELRLQAGTPGRLDQRAVRARPALAQAVEGCIAAIQSAIDVLEPAAVRSRDLGRCALRASELRQRLQAWVDEVMAPTRDEPGGEARAGTGRALARPTGPADAAEDAAPGGGLPGGAGIDFADTRILWAEVSAHGCTLHTTPLSVAGTFRRHRQQAPRAWVFLSATLAVGGSLDHFATMMGLEDARKLVWPSPFDYASQALLYVPRGLGEPSGPQYAERLVEAVWPLLVANGGRAFVLCTTLRMVEKLSALLGERIEAQGGPLMLLQQGKGSRAELLARFRSLVAPILVGSASFWEGVDVQGEQLSLVVIDKLPFAPPDDPIVKARADAARLAGHDPFRSLHLPAAAMALKQGAGRLIRSETDRGLLVVGDDRLAEKPYGRSLLRSLPPFRRTREADDALAFVSARTATSGD